MQCLIGYRSARASLTLLPSEPKEGPGMLPGLVKVWCKLELELVLPSHAAPRTGRIFTAPTKTH